MQVCGSSSGLKSTRITGCFFKVATIAAFFELVTYSCHTMVFIEVFVGCFRFRNFKSIFSVVGNALDVWLKPNNGKRLTFIEILVKLIARKWYISVFISYFCRN